jgi:hypothetical protein
MEYSETLFRAEVSGWDSVNPVQICPACLAGIRSGKVWLGRKRQRYHRSHPNTVTVLGTV